MSAFMPASWRWLRQIASVGSMILGGGFVMGLIIVMNSPVDRRQEPPAAHGPVIAMERASRPTPKPRPRPERRKASPARAAAAPPPSLAAGLSGVEMGIAAPGGLDLSGQAKVIGDTAAIRDTVMTSETVDVLPRPLQTVQPSYPSRARARGVTGFVKLSLQIGSAGEVLAVRVTQSEPPGVFDQSAVEAIRRWRFAPATFKGQPVKVWVTQRLTFKLS